MNDRNDLGIMCSGLACLERWRSATAENLATLVSLVLFDTRKRWD